MDVSLLVRGLLLNRETEHWLNNTRSLEAYQLVDAPPNEFGFCTTLCEALQVACASDAAVALRALQKVSEMQKPGQVGNPQLQAAGPAGRGGRGNRGRGIEHMSLKSKPGPTLKKPVRAAATSNVAVSAPVQEKTAEEERNAHLGSIVLMLNSIVQTQELALIVVGLRMQAGLPLPTDEDRGNAGSTMLTVDTTRQPTLGHDEILSSSETATQPEWLETMKRLLLLVSIQVHISTLLLTQFH